MTTSSRVLSRAYDRATVARLVSVARPIIMKWSRERTNCIAATAVVIDTLSAFGIHAEPLVCRVRVFNAEYVRCVENFQRYNPNATEVPRLIQESWKDRGAHSLWIGYYTIDGLASPGFDGHLIARVPHLQIALDASIDQCDRPAHNIGPFPGVLVLPWDGRGNITGEDVGGNGTRIEYDAMTDDAPDYTSAPDWRYAVDECVAELVDAVRAGAT